MTSPPKPRRKKAPEPLDWRELAAGPALRGLVEVLSTPAGVARERASRRAELEVQADPPVDSPSVGVSPVEPSVLFPAPPEPPPAVGDTPSAPVTTSEGESPTEVRTPTASAPSSRSAFRAEPSLVDVMPTEVLTPTEDVTPSVGDPASVVEIPANSPAQTQLAAHLISTPRHVMDRPSVVDTPTEGGSWWVDATGARYAGKRVQRVAIAQHSLSLGEERVYQTLWGGHENDGVISENAESKLFSLGYDRIARLVRLNEKSVRVLLPKLIAKKVLDVVAAEHSANRIGRTYRIFSADAILDRQRAANLTNIVKNGRAVEFVWPVGGTPTAREPGAGK